MTYPIGTLFNILSSNKTRLSVNFIRRIEEIKYIDNRLYYQISYPFHLESKPYLFTYDAREIQEEDILTEEEIIKLNKLLTFQ